MKLRYWPETLTHRVQLCMQLLMLATALASVALWQRTAEDGLRTAIAGQYYALLSARADQVGELLAARKAGMVSLAETVPQQNYRDAALLRQALDARPSVTTQFYNLAVFDRHGELVFTYRQQPRARTSIWARPYFIEALRTRSTVVSPPIIGGLSGQPLVIICVPVYDAQAQLQYVLTGALALGSQALLPAPDSRAPGVQYLMTADGYLLSHPDSRLLARHVHSVAELNAVAELAEHSDQGWRLSSARDGDQLEALRRVAGTQWLIGARIPADLLFAPVLAARRAALMPALAVAAAAGVLSWLLVRLLFAPLRRLNRQATAAADRGVPFVAPGGPAEVVALGRAIAALARQTEAVSPPVEAPRPQAPVQPEHAVPEAEPVAPVVPETGGQFDPAAFMAASQLEGEAARIFIDALAASLQQLPVEVANVEQQLAQGQVAAAAGVLHSLRGAWGSLGARDFATAAQAYERAIRSGATSATLQGEFAVQAELLQWHAQEWLADQRSNAHC